jgi:hypothetical protein
LLIAKRLLGNSGERNFNLNLATSASAKDSLEWGDIVIIPSPRNKDVIFGDRISIGGIKGKPVSNPSFDPGVRFTNYFLTNLAGAVIQISRDISGWDSGASQ